MSIEWDIYSTGAHKKIYMYIYSILKTFVIAML